MFHGDRDMIVNPVNGDQVIAQAKAASDLGSPSAAVRHPEGRVTPAPFRCMKAGDRFSSSGSCTEPATHDPAVIPPDRTPTHAGSTPVAR